MRHCHDYCQEHIFVKKERDFNARTVYKQYIKQMLYIYIIPSLRIIFFSTKTNSIEYKSKFVEQICLYKVATKYLHENRS